MVVTLRDYLPWIFYPFFILTLLPILFAPAPLSIGYILFTIIVSSTINYPLLQSVGVIMILSVGPVLVTLSILALSIGTDVPLVMFIPMYIITALFAIGFGYVISKYGNHHLLSSNLYFVTRIKYMLKKWILHVLLVLDMDNTNSSSSTRTRTEFSQHVEQELVTMNISNTGGRSNNRRSNAIVAAV